MSLRPHVNMSAKLSTALLLAVVALSTASNINIKRVKTRCGNFPCATYKDHKEQCSGTTGRFPGCGVLTKVSNAYENGQCCNEYECSSFNRDEPCCGVSCEANTPEAADDLCNIIHPNNEVWNDLAVERGTRYALMVKHSNKKRGQCCDKYQCKTDHAKLCANETQKSPCVQSCPVCHSARVVSPVDQAKGKCCPDIVCVKNATCLCDKEHAAANNASCPMPVCSDLEYPVLLSEATDDNCCPSYACQRNMTAICMRKRNDAVQQVPSPTSPTATVTLRGWNSTSPQDVCGPCADVVKYKPADFEAGKCFPDFQCKEVKNKCCKADLVAGEGKTMSDLSTPCALFNASCDAANCEVQVMKARNPKRGKCCDRYSCVLNTTCLCSRTTCPYADAEEYKLINCPSRGPNTKDFYRVKTIEAKPSAGQCCNKYSCVETAAKKMKDVRLAKRKARKAQKAAKKAAKRAAKQTTISSR